MIESLIDMSLEAGAAIVKVYQQMRPEQASIKGDGSPVTQADILAEQIILARLAKLAPGVPVVAEEAVAAGTIPDTKGVFFLVDPLDGTKEFLSRNGDFTVNIALIENGAPVLGVVYAPAIGKIFTGSRADGARRATVVDGAPRSWESIRVRPPSATGLKVIASRSHLNQETKDFVERFPGAEFVSAGSSLKFCLVAGGEADLYPRLARTMEWDIAAGDAVLRAAGGSVTDLDGVPMRYGKRNQSTDADFANGWFIASGMFDWRDTSKSG